MSGARDSGRWLMRLRPPAQAVELRLFLFHHAGAGVHAFLPWLEHVPPEIDVFALQLPGRGERIAEPAVEAMAPLIDAVHAAATPLLDVPYVFFGHSFGALVAFELTGRLLAGRLPAPRRLVVSGRRAPSTGAGRRPMHALPDEEFEACIRNFGGTPAVLLEDPELRELFLGVLRADFKVIETHVHEPRLPLDVPLSIFCGEEDREAPLELMRPWREEVRGPSSIRTFAGGHFFALERARTVVRALLEDIGFSASPGATSSALSL